MSKPLPSHGTTARAKGRPAAGIPGCACRPCRDAENAYDKRRRYLNATGRALTMDATPVKQHIETLFANGAGWVQLAQAAHVSQSNLSRIRRGLQPVVARAVAVRILAVKPGEAVPAGRPIPAAGSIRRAQALMAIGHRMKDVYATAGLDHTTLSDLIGERLTTVTQHTAGRMRDAYDAMCGTPGSNARAINRAQRLGWRDPAFWEDYGRIDDPAFNPATVERELKRDELAALRRADITHLADCGYLPEAIHQRLMAGGHDIALSTVRAVVLEHRTGTKRQRGKQVVAA